MKVRKHGTRSKYAGGCRCDLCRAANAAEMRAYRARKGREGHAEASRRQRSTRKPGHNVFKVPLSHSIKAADDLIRSDSRWPTQTAP